MACSAIYFLDNKGKVLINRNYRGDIEGNVIDKFIGGSVKIYLCTMNANSKCIWTGRMGFQIKYTSFSYFLSVSQCR